MSRFSQETALPHSPEEVFRWHQRPRALERLSPPWERIVVVDEQGTAAGARTTIETGLGPLSTRWVAEHSAGPDERSFVDRQVEGPFASWEHLHRVRARGAEECTLEDQIDYRLPFGKLGALLGGGYVRSRLARAFEYRSRVLSQDLARHRPETAAMEVALTGASGMVGSALGAFLSTGGHTLRPMVRRAVRDSSEIRWDPEGDELDVAALAGVDAVVHLAGESIAAGRWTDERKRRIRDSRVRGTGLLARRLAESPRPPKVLVCASAIGFYGDRPGEELDEFSASGEGFLAEVCREWEAACQPARDAGIRVVNIRIGVVLSPAGGALAKMLTPFKLGGGGPIGNGRQVWSWISIDDLVGSLHHALVNEDLVGPVNAVAPAPVTNAEFTRTLGRVLRRPAVVPLPKFAARLALGEMADELLLASARVRPRQLEESGYRFDHPELEGALRHLLGRPSNHS